MPSLANHYRTFYNRYANGCYKQQGNILNDSSYSICCPVVEVSSTLVIP
jgi:hypothetical protein